MTLKEPEGCEMARKEKATLLDPTKEKWDSRVARPPQAGIKPAEGSATRYSVFFLSCTTRVGGWVVAEGGKVAAKIQDGINKITPGTPGILARALPSWKPWRWGGTGGAPPEGRFSRRKNTLAAGHQPLERAAEGTDRESEANAGGHRQSERKGTAEGENRARRRGTEDATADA